MPDESAEQPKVPHNPEQSKRHLRVVQGPGGIGTEAVTPAIHDVHEHMEHHRKNLSRDELRKLREGIGSIKNRQNLDPEAKRKVEAIDQQLEQDRIEAPLLDPKLGDRAASAMPEFMQGATKKVVDVANEAVQGLREEGEGLVKNIKERAKEFPQREKDVGFMNTVKTSVQRVWNNEGITGKILVVTGVIATIAAVRWFWNKLKEGSFLAWTALIGGLAGLAYWNSERKIAAVEAPPGESILAKEQSINVDGKNRTFQVNADGTMNLDDKHGGSKTWKIAGSGLDVSIKHATKDKNGAYHLNAIGSLMGVKKAQSLSYNQEQITALIKQLDANEPPTMKIKTDVNFPFIPQEIEVTLKQQ